MLKNELRTKPDAKGLPAISRLLLLAACTKTQENRFDIPKGKLTKTARSKPTLS